MNGIACIAACLCMSGELDSVDDVKLARDIGSEIQRRQLRLSRELRDERMNQENTIFPSLFPWEHPVPALREMKFYRYDSAGISDCDVDRALAELFRRLRDTSPEGAMPSLP